MCKSGVNNSQLGTMLGMTEDTLKLVDGWLDEIHHLADHAGLDSAGDVAQAKTLLAGAAALLHKASHEAGHDHDHGDHVHVELV